MAVTPFHDLYPFAPFEAVSDVSWWRAQDFRRQAKICESDLEARQAAAAADAADQERFKEHKRAFSAAVGIHLANLQADGQLERIEGLAGRDIPIATAWNDLVDGKPADRMRGRLASSFSKTLVMEFVRMDEGRRARMRDEAHVPGSHQAPPREMAIKAWSTICALMDAGEQVPGMPIECTDSKTGDRCEIQIEGWKPTLMRWNEKYELVPAADVAEAQLACEEFRIATGRLMLTDVLRIDSFLEGIEFPSDREYGEIDLNSDRGKDARIAAHAKDHGIAYTQTTNTCVAIHRHAESGDMIVTSRWAADVDGEEAPEDERGISVVDGWISLGAFSCDRWSVMAFDREVALERMRAGGCEAPAAVLDEYLASGETYAKNVLQLDVEPGLWRIRSGTDFSARFDREERKVPQGTFVWCLLERAGD